MTDLKDDLLDSVDAIGEYIKKTPRQTYYLLERGLLPAFKLGGKWTARKSTLHRHIEQLEAGEVR